MGRYRQRERGSFEGEFGGSHCNQWGLCSVRRSCEKLRQSINMSFVVVSGVCRSMGVLEGVHVSQVEGALSRVFHFHNFGGVNKHFQTKHAKYSNVYNIEATAWIPTKFCIPVKTSKYASWVA